MSEPELNVVCRSCGEQVSPYVTECPYCGTRLRKRAPELEQRDGGLARRLNWRERRQQARRERATTRPRTAPPLALPILLAVPAAALLVRISLGLDLTGFGAAVTPLDGQWWRVLTAPFVYGSIGYLFLIGVVLVLYVPGFERRIGTVPALLLLVATGSLGMLAGCGIGELFNRPVLASGGNGLALGAVVAGFLLARGDGGESHRADPALAAATAVAVLLLPLVVDAVDPWVAVAGGAVGGLAALAAVRTGS